MPEYDLGRARRLRRAYSFDDVSVVPSRRTRDAADVDLSWQIDAYRFEAPIMAAPVDSVMSPDSAALVSDLGLLAVLGLEGLWCRYADPGPHLAEIAELPDDRATARMQQIYAQPIDRDLVTQRVRDMHAAGRVVAAAVSPGRAAELAPVAVAAGLDLLVIRGTTVSAEHVADMGEPIDLKRFIGDLETPVIVGGCANYQAALHLMRTGAAGVLVGFGEVPRTGRRMCWGCEFPWRRLSPKSPRPAGTTWTNPADATSMCWPTAPWGDPVTWCGRWPVALTPWSSDPCWPAGPMRPVAATTGDPKPSTRRCPAVNEFT